MTSRLIALLILTVSILTACGRANASTHPATAGYLIFLEGGFSNAGEIVKVLDSGTGTVVRELPIGTPAPDWSRYYVVTQLTGSAQLKAIDPASGRTIAQTTIPSGYSLPNIAFQGPTAGISPNGQWLALTKSSPSVTNFLLGSSSPGVNPARVASTRHRRRRRTTWGCSSTGRLRSAATEAPSMPPTAPSGRWP